MPHALWANPVLPKEITALHEHIHELIDKNSCRDHYQPVNWVPHCSVATSIPMGRKAEALEVVHRKFEPFEVVFDVADLVSFLPVRIEREVALIDTN